MLEILAGIFVVGFAAIALFWAFIGICWFIGESLTLIAAVVISPWTLYRRWQKRQMAHEEVLAKRAATISEIFAREAQLQKNYGPEYWR